MSPLEFLKEEFENVERALQETLRYDYVPERSKQYYTECAARLDEIRKAIGGIVATDLPKISEQIYELSLLANWISLIERSHLGEFSWPFAEELHRLATSLLFETSMAGKRLNPVIHVVAEGRGYRIIYEPQVPSASGRCRFVVVAFPRSLKHHVLLHAIFGHEVCHTAFHTATAGGVLHRQVVPALTNAGPLLDATAATDWLYHAKAPADVQLALKQYSSTYGWKFELAEEFRQSWLVELMCDLFGLLLFGPGFLAAHRALLQPMHPNPYEIDLLGPTHPPYAVRHRMLVRVMRLVGWDKPITVAADADAYTAENELLKFLLDDTYDPWVTVFDDAQLQTSIAAIQGLFAVQPHVGYRRPNAQSVVALVDRLKRGLPPLLTDLEPDGKPKLQKIDISQVLYAGWIYWTGRSHLTGTVPLDFFLTNRLCDQALLQQRAINIAIDAGIT